MHAEAKGNYKDRIHKHRDHRVKAGVIPQDVIIVGTESPPITIDGSTGLVTFDVTITGTASPDITIAGSTGEVTFGVNVWKFDETAITFDATDPTFDGKRTP
jgi:hypothetical protein